MNGDWLYFSHVKNTIHANLIGRVAFFTGENIAHIEFYLQGLLPKILAIYTIEIDYFIESTLYGFLFTSCKTLENERVSAANE